MSDHNLSLVPYASNNKQIVLRHGSAVVLYDDKSNQISLRRTDEVEDLEPTKCPLCGKPLDQSGPENAGDAESPVTSPSNAGFVNPGYFRMLHSSRPASHQSSRATSPQLQLERIDTNQTPGPRGRSSPGIKAHSGSYSHKISPDAFSQNYFKTFFVEEGELGRGGKGVVLLVRHVIDGVDLGRFACKRVPVGDDSEWLRKVLIEVQLLQTLSHTNLVSYQHVWLENFRINTFSPAIPCAFILQQYCNAGDLHRYLFGADRTFNKEELKARIRTRSKTQMETPQDLHNPRRLHFEEIFSFFRDITSGLNFLHRNNYIHRDLKPSNCLLHRTGPHVRVLVSDFGEMQGADLIRQSTGSTGTISFCAPEVLRETSPGVFGNFSQKSDVFSLGLIVYLMCFGRLPYASADTAAEENEDIDQLKDEISAWTGIDLEHRVRSDLPERLYKYMKLLLSLDPSERPGTDEILSSIKAGSAIHEQGQPRQSSSPPLEADGETIGEKDSGGLGPTAVAIDTRRRQSALAKPSSATEVVASQAESRRTSSPRMLSGAVHSSARSDALKRRLSADTIVAKNSLQGPRLLKAPQRRKNRVVKILAQSTARTWGKLAVFCLKVFTCLKPCSPAATRTWIAYPLLGVAALCMADVGESQILPFALLVLHLVVLGVASYTQCLCEVRTGAAARWDSQMEA